MSYDLGGFSITAATSRTMIAIFVVYTIIIVGFGLYIKLQARKGNTDGLASFLTGAVGLVFFTTGQITAGAKVFAAVTGSNAYYLGILLVIVITVVYTLSGGVKSMAKVAVVQGVIMLLATFSISQAF